MSQTCAYPWAIHVSVPCPRAGTTECRCIIIYPSWRRFPLILPPERSRYVGRNRVKWSHMLHSVQSRLMNLETPEQRKLKCTSLGWAQERDMTSAKYFSRCWKERAFTNSCQYLSISSVATTWVLPEECWVKASLVDNPWAGEWRTLLPTTQEEQEGARTALGTSSTSAPSTGLSSPQWSLAGASPTWVTFIHLCPSKTSYSSLKKVPLNGSTEMGELPQLCAGTKNLKAARSSCQAWLIAWYYKFPGSYFWRSEEPETKELLFLNGQLFPQHTEKKTIYIACGRQFQGQPGSGLYPACPQLLSLVKKAWKAQGIQPGLCCRGTTQALETCTDGVFGEQAVSECRLSN